MTVAHLGETFDLHGGGKDLIFPHHENEIAQSQGAHGDHTFARYWMHNGFLNFAGEKMSKSLGNVFNCDQIAEAVGGEALRFFCVSHHYRSPVDFEIESIRDADGNAVGVKFNSLEAADRRLEYFYLTLQRIDTFLLANPGDATAGKADKDATAWVDVARDALADDFNAPVVIAAMGDAAKLANKLLDSGKGVSKDDRRRTLAVVAETLRNVGLALGIFENDPVQHLRERRARLVKRRNIDVARVEALLTERTTARAEKNFTRADEIRGELTALNVEMFDAPGGTDWRVRDDG
jgi:cysteinyl-tRNA synthetase